jgi:hypothetical protein
MIKFNSHSVIAKLLKNYLDLSDIQFMLMDVGASGGISDVWRQLSPKLKAYGFDPLLNEVVRLNNIEKDPSVCYIGAWVTDGWRLNQDPPFTPAVFDTHSFQLTSSALAISLMGVNYQKDIFNSGGELKYSSERISIDEFCTRENLACIDFIKTDTDGYDFQALLGAKDTLVGRGVLGLLVECNFQGNTSETANLFSNIDRFLRSLGFALFSMDTWSYSRADLPALFCYDIPAQTKTGQVQWGDALYCLDPLTRPELFETLSQAKLLKLLAIYDLFSLPDCVAALLVEITRRDIDIPSIDIPELLNALVPHNPYGKLTYQEYLELFKKDPTTFYPSKWNRPN